MDRRQAAGPALLVAVVALAVALLLRAAWLSAWNAVAAPGPAAADELLALVVASLAAGVGTWLVCGMVLEVAARLPGRWGRTADRWSRRVTPALARRAASLVLGVGVGVVSGPAQCVAVGPPLSAAAAVADRAHAHQHGEPAPDPGFRAAPTPPAAPGFTPGPPLVRPQPDPSLIGGRIVSRNDADVDVGAEVVVHRGDSLWSIAARHLGPDASDAEIDRSWRRWFALNRDVVGPDPDLVLPGQLLRVPEPESEVTLPR